MTAIEFRAPWGRVLRLATGVSLAVLLVVMIAGLTTWGRAPWPATLLLLGLPLLIVLGALPFMVRGYVLDEHRIVVCRGGWQTVLPLAGLISVTGDATAMHGSIKVFGNGGLFSFTGEFWNRRLRRYRALATDPDRAVVLRYPDRTIVITPHDPQQFIMRARTFLKTSGFPTDR